MSDIQNQEETSRLKWLIPVVAVCIVAPLIYWGVTSLKSGSGHKQQKMAKIALLPDAPPPPPPPPPEKKPEPEVKEDKPQPQPEDAPKALDKPPEDVAIKMEGAAGDGPSAFGAGSVSKDYTNGDPNAGGTGGGDRLQQALVKRRLQKHILSALSRDKSIKLGDYRATVSVWIGERGDVRVVLDGSAGDDKFDEALRVALSKLPPLLDVPPGLHLPIRLAISNRMTG